MTTAGRLQGWKDHTEYAGDTPPRTCRSHRHLTRDGKHWIPRRLVLSTTPHHWAIPWQTDLPGFINRTTLGRAALATASPAEAINRRVRGTSQPRLLTAEPRGRLVLTLSSFKQGHPYSALSLQVLRQLNWILYTANTEARPPKKGN